MVVWKKKTTKDNAVRKMPMLVQIEGHLWYAVATEKTTFIPPKGMMRVSVLYFHNFPVF